MNNRNSEPELATEEEIVELTEQLREYDKQNMLDCSFELPSQIISAIETSEEYDYGDIPLDHNRIHLLGLGGSAIAGDLLKDILSPLRKITIHRGTKPPRDRCGIVVSSYSGNTREIVELSTLVIGGLRSAIFVTSGGDLAQIGREFSQPVWKIPTGYQPRASIGWSVGYLVSIMERWCVIRGYSDKILKAARRLKGSLSKDDSATHPLLRAAVPIARALEGRNGLIFHSLGCAGAARRLAAQINENGKQPAFAVLMPEGMHNAIEGIAGGDPERWTIIYLIDPNDPVILRESLRRSIDYFENKGFVCKVFPAAGKDQAELTLSRVLIGDFVSLFLAASRGIDPTPIITITELKRLDPNQSGDDDSDTLEEQ